MFSNVCISSNRQAPRLHRIRQSGEPKPIPTIPRKAICKTHTRYSVGADARREQADTVSRRSTGGGDTERREAGVRPALDREILKSRREAGSSPPLDRGGDTERREQADTVSRLSTEKPCLAVVCMGLGA